MSYEPGNAPPSAPVVWQRAPDGMPIRCVYASDGAFVARCHEPEDADAIERRQDRCDCGPAYRRRDAARAALFAVLGAAK